VITIKYSPHGLPRSDWSGKEIIRNIKEYINQEIAPTIHVSNEIIILAIRAAVKNKEINCKDICFIFDKHIIHLNEDGRFTTSCPEGFCDISEKYLIDLL
jgi:hypothetical protein